MDNGLSSLGHGERVTADGIKSVMGNPTDKCVDILLPGLRNNDSGLLEVLGNFERKAIKTAGGPFF